MALEGKNINVKINPIFIIYLEVFQERYNYNLINLHKIFIHNIYVQLLLRTLSLFISFDDNLMIIH